MAKLLAIDDEPQILTALVRGFGRVGHEVLVADTGEDGLATAASARPDLVLLDLRLPGSDGIEVVRRLRSWSLVPIVLLSGAGTERSRIAALDAGADDFVDKPFSMDELRARVDAALRRSSGNRGDGVGEGTEITFGDITVDLAARSVKVEGSHIRLTPTQWRLLELLVSNPGRILTYSQVIEAVWSAQHGDEARESLRAHLRSLRQKLRDDAASPRYIETEPGVGYRWLGDPVA